MYDSINKYQYKNFSFFCNYKGLCHLSLYQEDNTVLTADIDLLSNEVIQATIPNFQYNLINDNPTAMDTFFRRFALSDPGHKFILTSTDNEIVYRLSYYGRNSVYGVEDVCKLLIEDDVVTIVDEGVIRSFPINVTIDELNNIFGELICMI